MNQIDLSFCVFPEDWDKDGSAAASGLYPASRNSKRVAHVLKRSLDISGSLAALLVGAPVFLAVAAAVKLTSSGPVFFKQERVGQHGRKFSFLKFRSMYVNNDQEIHKKYVQSLIEGNAASGNGTGCQTAVFKLTNDPRITSVGRFLRKASLDEIPQFLNVLMGDMSLVGPRPPIPYEVESYDIWHRRRLLAVKPGITGLWQVSGRSRTTFDEMVRLDLQYARSWSVFMDLEILLRTPRAVVSGDGAY
jgi:exopolysaccharide biosynthesis polyprenyl glycosylphosphotransferase